MLRAGLLSILIVNDVSGFVLTQRRHHAETTRFATEVAYNGYDDSMGTALVLSDHLSPSRTRFHVNGFAALVKQSKENSWECSKNRFGKRSAQRSSPGLPPGVVTQLGGWSYARTVFSSGKTSEGDGEAADAGSSDGADSSASSTPEGQSHSSNESPGSGKKAGGSSNDARGGRLSGMGGDGEGDDGDGDGEEHPKQDGVEEADSWDADSDSEEDRAVLVPVGAQDSTAPADTTREDYEVVCDGDVCEMRPKNSSLASAGMAVENDSVVARAAVMAGSDTAAVAASGEVTKQDESHADDGGIEDQGGDGDDNSGLLPKGGEDGAEDGLDGGGVAAEEGQEVEEVPLTDDPDVAQLVSMGWDAEESAAALQEANGDVLGAAEALAEREEADLERYQEGLALLQEKGWDEDVAMAAIREAQGNSTQALEALQEEDRMLSMQFEESIAEMVEHGWDKEVARKALLMQWQKDIEGRGGGRKAQKQFEKTAKDVQAKGAAEGKDGGGKKKEKTPGTGEPPAPTPAKREDVIFDVTDKNIQKVVLESPVPVLLDLYAEWCGPCKQLTPALEEAAMRSGGMFRLAKIDAEKQRSLAEVLGITAFPSVFGMKDGILLDNFVGILPQDEMQSFMMGVIMGIPRPKDKPLREHQKGSAELRGMSRKLAHVAGLAVLGSRKKETLCLKVDKALSKMLQMPPLADGNLAAVDAVAVAAAKKAARTVITVLMSAYKYPEDPKYRSLSTSSKVFTDVLSPYPPMLEVLRLAGFRHKDGDLTHLTLMHRNMAVLASVQDRVEAWNKATKMPAEEEEDDDDDEYDTEEEEDEEARLAKAAAKAHLASNAKLQITTSSRVGGGNDSKIFRMEMPARATLGELFATLKQNHGFGDDLVLTTAFPKRELAAGDESCHSDTLLDLSLAPSARLIATDLATLAAEKEKKHGDDEEEASRIATLKAKMMEKSKDPKRKANKHGGSLFGADDGIIEVQKGKNVQYFGGDSTVTLAAEEEEEEKETDKRGIDDNALKDDFGDQYTEEHGGASGDAGEVDESEYYLGEGGKSEDDSTHDDDDIKFPAAAAAAASLAGEELGGFSAGRFGGDELEGWQEEYDEDKEYGSSEGGEEGKETDEGEDGEEMVSGRDEYEYDDEEELTPYSDEEGESSYDDDLDGRYDDSYEDEEDRNGEASSRSSRR